ncbi:MAG: rhodanese [Desulfobulbus propionicus]|nr:MAG: rhodanese [Desulfobulbus propionicus]PIE63668.1 MAG: rhodanese [Desulfobacterales bacterium]
MTIFKYEAKELFQWLTEKQDIVILDVRNDKDFKRFQVESPYPFTMLNISYYDFMEIEEECVAKVPRDKEIRIVCAKEGSAKYVAEILEKHDFKNIGYLAGGIKSWGNLLVPKCIEQQDDFTLYQFIRPGKASCSYGLISGDEIMFFDPSRAVDFYLDFAKEHNCKVVRTFETHLQADYIAGSRDIAARTGAVFHGNEGDFSGSKNAYTKLVDGEQFTFSNGGPTVQILFTPGHTPGSTSFIIAGKYIVSGDTIFIDSIGRPDLGGKAEEWAHLLFETIGKVKQLDTQLQVLPGHYIDWKEANSDLVFILPLSEVIERNKHIYDIADEAAFTQFIKDNMRPQPEEYATIRLVNANLEQFEDDKQEELDLGKNECAASAYAAAQSAAAQ